jgi:hypothetical protein
MGAVYFGLTNEVIIDVLLIIKVITLAKVFSKHIKLTGEDLFLIYAQI